MSTTLQRSTVLALATALVVAVGFTAPADGATGDPVPTSTAADVLERRTEIVGDPRIWPDDALAGRLIVSGRSTAVRALTRALSSDAGGRGLLNAPVARTSDLAEGISLVEVEPGTEVEAAARLRDQPGITAVEPDFLSTLDRRPNDPAYGTQWPHHRTGIEGMWSERTDAVRPDGTPVVVAVLDSGVDARVPDLADRVLAQGDVSTGRLVTRENIGNNDTCYAAEDVATRFGHGTAVAGVIGAIGNNGVDLAGVAWNVGILDIAVLSDDASIPESSRCRGIPDSAIIAGVAAATTGVDGVTADVINLSLGRPAASCPSALQKVLDDSRASGVVLVGAAGNSGRINSSTSSVPASCNGVLSVGATTIAGTRAPYSDANAWIDLVAPGGDRGDPVPLLAHGSSSTSLVHETGTSFASPYVAGVAAMLLAARPGLAPADVTSIFQRTSSGSERTNEMGFGEVRPAAALEATDGTIPPPQQTRMFPVSPGLRSLPAMPIGEAVRIAMRTGHTDPIEQAVAMSSATFTDDGAVHAVVARSDAFPDALAGSSLGFGFGPMLFTSSSGRLSPMTRVELQRVLPAGRTVYVLGGHLAVPESVVDELGELGWEVRRLAGLTRDETAVAVADEVRRRLPELGFGVPDTIILATNLNWPDAVTAGALGAQFGMPIVLTPPDTLSLDTAAALARYGPDKLIVVGGTLAVSPEVLDAAHRASGASSTIRVSGPSRDTTAVAIAGEVQSAFTTFFAGQSPTFAMTVNLRRDDGWAHVLSGSAFLGGYGMLGGVFLPVDGETGDLVPSPALRFACGKGMVSLVAGNVDIVTDDAARRLASTQVATDC